MSKYLIVDTGNDGIVFVGQYLTTVNSLRRGLLDCETFRIRTNNSYYDELSKEVVFSQHLHWTSKEGKLSKLKDNSINDIYLEKKRLAKIREPALHSLMYNWGPTTSRKLSISHFANIETDIAMAILQSNNGHYHHQIVEYSNIMGIPPAEGYKELKLMSENFQTQKIRIFSYIEFFIKKINQSTDEDEIEEIKEDIMRKFKWDNWL
jgi:hypothetical protein